MLDGADAELRRLAWRSISHSAGASARFLDRAVASLDQGELLEPPYVLREVRLLESASQRRRDDVLELLARLQRHRDREVADMARQTLERLTREPPR